jgi:hypothetical protein
MRICRQFWVKYSVPGVVALGLMLLGAQRAAAQEERVLYEAPAAGCTLAVTAEDRWQGIRLRRRPAGSDCRIDAETAIAALTRAFEATFGGPRFTSLFLGRIEYLDWMSRHLVARARGEDGWAAAHKGSGAHNAYVGRVLAEPQAAGVLDGAAAAGGYRIAGVSCEKVLVSGPDTRRFQPGWVPDGARVPFDAMCWLKLAPAG